MEKLHAGRIRADPEIGVEILPKTTGGVKPDFLKHAGEIHEARGLLERAAGKRSGIGRLNHCHDSVVSAALSMDRDFAIFGRPPGRNHALSKSLRKHYRIELYRVSYDG
jgi:hypothetical protein